MTWNIMQLMIPNDKYEKLQNEVSETSITSRIKNAICSWNCTLPM